MPEFEEYLNGKKIDPQQFKAAEPERWQDFEQLFYQVHPNSFTQQKLFLLNPLRRRYPYKPPETTEEVPKKKAARPVMRRKKP